MASVRAVLALSRDEARAIAVRAQLLDARRPADLWLGLSVDDQR